MLTEMQTNTAETVDDGSTEEREIIEEAATDFQPDVQGRDEVVHGVNCVCKLYMGTCINNTINV